MWVLFYEIVYLNNLSDFVIDQCTSFFLNVLVGFELKLLRFIQVYNLKKKVLLKYKYYPNSYFYQYCVHAFDSFEYSMTVPWEGPNEKPKR